jgi:hypothetical protein
MARIWGWNSKPESKEPTPEGAAREMVKKDKQLGKALKQRDAVRDTNPVDFEEE